MSDIVHLDGDERGQFTYKYNDGIRFHGQHYKMYGSCGYVNYHLINKEFLDMIKNNKNKK